jgi:sugar/nucleoside kinase (ribokinase family)
MIDMKIRNLTDLSDCFNIEFQDNRDFDLVGFGLNAVDHLCVVPSFPRFDSKTEILHYEKLAGGQVATAVVFVSRLGVRAKYIGKVGTDEMGDLSLKNLASEDIDTASVLVESGTRNQYAFIIIDQRSGERTILWERDERLNFRDSELRKEDICAGRILYLDGHDHHSALQAARWAQEENIPVVADLDKVMPQFKSLISMIDFLICSENVPREFAGLEDTAEALRALKDHCRGFVAVTLGDRGAAALVGDELIRFPAYDVHAVDTTGAGDIFHGGFIYGLLQNWPLEKIMSFANAAAGLNCTQLGARAGLPVTSEIIQLMESGRHKPV